MSSELRSRLAVAALGVPGALFIAYRGGWYLALPVALVAALCAREFYALAASKTGSPLGWLGAPAAAALVLMAAHAKTFPLWGDRALVLLLLLGLFTFTLVAFSRRSDEGPLLSAAATVSGTLYTGGTLAFSIFLYHLPTSRGSVPAVPWEGSLLVLFPLWVTWAGDSVAYFVGKRFGKTKLVPRVSPGKTVEGGAGGLAGSALAGGGMGLLMADFPNFPITPLAGVVIGLLLSVGGQLGDLTESALKREAGVKDSGTLLAGHGGTLDRFDSLFFSFPLAYGLILLYQHLR